MYMWKGGLTITKKFFSFKYKPLNAVKCNLTKLTPKSSGFSILVSSPGSQCMCCVDMLASQACRFVACNVGPHKQLPVCVFVGFLHHFHLVSYSSVPLVQFTGFSSSVSLS